MIIVKVDNSQSLEKALKVLKRKWEKSKILKELRDRKVYKKKSAKRRDEILKAIYIQDKYKNND